MRARTRRQDVRKTADRHNKSPTEPLMFRKSVAVPCAVAAVLGASGWGTALAGVPLPTVGGKIYADLTYLDEKENDTKIAPSGAGVDVKRFYLVFNEKFDDMWSANVTT